MHNQKKVLTNYRSMLSLTSLTAAEFFQLLSVFDVLWQHYHTYHDLKGQKRRIEKSSEHRSMSLKGSAGKPLFVLVYLKQHPLQAYQGFNFGLSQGKVSHWLRVLLQLQEQTLAKLQQLPCRESSDLYISLRLLSNQVLLLDATERAILRSVAEEWQKHEYSGKQGGHTIKNLLSEQSAEPVCLCL
jgi:hypothetical protein